MPHCYLSYVTGSMREPEFQAYPKVSDAVAAFKETARELCRSGQGIDAAIHIAKKRSLIDEYPDYVLSCCPSCGHIKKEAT